MVYAEIFWRGILAATPKQPFHIVVQSNILQQCIVIGFLILSAFKVLLWMLNTYLSKVLLSDCGNCEGRHVQSSKLKNATLYIIDPYYVKKLRPCVSGGGSGSGPSRRNVTLFGYNTPIVYFIPIGPLLHFGYLYYQRGNPTVSPGHFLSIHFFARADVMKQLLVRISVWVFLAFGLILWMLNTYLLLLLSGGGTTTIAKQVIDDTGWIDTNLFSNENDRKMANDDIQSEHNSPPEDIACNDNVACDSEEGDDDDDDDGAHTTGDAECPSNNHDDTTCTSLHDDVKLKSGDKVDEYSHRRQHIALYREEGRTFYITGSYRDSVMCYTEAIRLHTAPPFHESKNDAILAALYGNRAAALLMTGAYEGASADCKRALLCIDESSSIAYESLDSGPAFRSKILCRMARALLKVGNVDDAEKAFNDSIQSARGALAIVGHQFRSGTGGTTATSVAETRVLEKILNQNITDATLGLLDVKEYRDAVECIKDLETSRGDSPDACQKVDIQLLMSINSALTVSPGSIELHERKVDALASLKRWAELGNHCERLAAETVNMDGLFTDDLASLNPFPDVHPAHSLTADFFDKNPRDLNRKLSSKAVCEAVIRMPKGILATYLRSLRLEERFKEADVAMTRLATHISTACLSTERDKLRRTMSLKEMGDTLFHDGDFEQAGEKYAQCLSIDNGMAYNISLPLNDNAGGRLHAVLHCNRAACLMSQKKYYEAVKECTAALRVHPHHMKAMLRRGRCLVRTRQYKDAIAEYERYIQLVMKARKSFHNAASNNGTCMFDRPIDVTEAECNQAKQELMEAKKSMRIAAVQDQHVVDLRDEGRTSYLKGEYFDSVLSYTEAIRCRTTHIIDPTNDELLATLYGNRAAALMMICAYEIASADCERASLFVNPNSTSIYESTECGPIFWGKISCRRARALLKAGNISDAETAFKLCIQLSTDMLGKAGNPSQSSGSEAIGTIKKSLNMSAANAKLGLMDVKKFRDAVESVNSTDNSSDELLRTINSALEISPGSTEMHERKVNSLATMKRWAELASHCERLAAETVKQDGIFTDDLAPLNPYPDVRPALSLRADFFEKNPDDLSDNPSMRLLGPKAVGEAVIRMPNKILPLYLRALRLEERFTEATNALSCIEAHMNESKHRGNYGNVSITLITAEKDKLQRTKSLKQTGDTMFKNGEYEHAGEKYAQCLTIDNNNMTYSNFFINENAGGRLHAVLHCNRAACFMALKKYREAVKECTAALSIHTHYMRAILRRGRSFAKMHKYEKAIADYKRYIQLVTEARGSRFNGGNNDAACTFDRPIDVPETTFEKVKQELEEVKRTMRNASEQRERQNGQHQQWQQWQRQQWQWQQNHRHQHHRHQHHRHQQQHQYQNHNQQYQNEQQHHYQNRNQHHYRQQHRYQQQEEQYQEQDQTETEDHYEVLELSPSATAAEIKKAYHKMALKYHPDKNPAENAAEMFRRAKDAHDVLINEQSRAAYDSRRRGGGR